MKKWLAIFLEMILMFVVAAAFGEETIGRGCIRRTVVPSGGLSGEEAIRGYIQQQMYFPKEGTGAQEKSGGAVGYNRLTETEQKLYDELKKMILKAAAGETDRTDFSVSARAVFGDFSCTAEELGMSTLTERNRLTAEAEDAFTDKLEEAFSLDDMRVLTALLVDCPYELYWFDKTVGISSSIHYSFSSDRIFFGEKDQIGRAFAVAKEYSATREKDTFRLKTSTGTAVKKAAENAKKIVSANKEKEDLAKLKAYKEEICRLNTYNQAAARSSSMAYGNPWQLIYVFDGDPRTNVVCEGYSKAFQYLCDQSSFQKDISVISVGGEMGTINDRNRIEWEEHMWNVVNIDGKRYLADITNCDDDSVETPDYLFLKGYTQYDKDYEVYVFSDAEGEEVFYAYDQEDFDLLGEELTISRDSCEEEKKEDKYQLNNRKTTAIFLEPGDRNASVLEIADQVRIGGKSYKVTEIAAGACRDMKNLTTVSIGKNVTTIGKNAFKGCKALDQIRIKTGKLKKVGSNAFKGIPSKVLVICPTHKTEKYRKLLTGKGLPQKAIFQ